MQGWKFIYLYIKPNFEHVKVSHRDILIWVLSIVAIVYFESCARPANPTGGPKDDQPASLVEIESTPNYQTNFSEREIILTFDEFISLKNANKQILVSPPFTNYLKYTVRGKKLIVEFPEDEELREDATYQINFGSSISDFTAGNVTENLTFVFSTGDKIDSLEIQGSVFDAATGKPMNEAIVVLYDNLSDTAVSTLKPFYFAQTDEEGNFKIQNIKEDSFQIFALTDANLSLNYDQSTEFIAYYDSLIILPDTSLAEIRLDLFDEREIPTVQKVGQRYKGYTVIKFSDEPRNVSMVSELDSADYNYLMDSDSLQVWYETSLDSFEMILDWEETLDTVLIKRIDKKKELPRLRCINCSEVQNKFPKDSLSLFFNRPIVAFDINQNIQIDSMDQFVIQDILLEGKEIKLIGQTLDTGIYELTLSPGFVTDRFGKTIDTTYLDIEGRSSDLLGSISITLQNYVEDRQFIYQLLDKEEEILSSKIMKGDSLLSFPKMIGGQYSLKIIEDLNENGYWDTGNLAKRSKSERIRTFALEQLRSGWDLETSLDLKNQF